MKRELRRQDIVGKAIKRICHSKEFVETGSLYRKVFVILEDNALFEMPLRIEETWKIATAEEANDCILVPARNVNPNVFESTCIREVVCHPDGNLLGLILNNEYGLFVSNEPEEPLSIFAKIHVSYRPEVEMIDYFTGQTMSPVYAGEYNDCYRELKREDIVGHSIKCVYRYEVDMTNLCEKPFLAYSAVIELDNGATFELTEGNREPENDRTLLGIKLDNSKIEPSPSCMPSCAGEEILEVIQEDGSEEISELGLLLSSGKVLMPSSYFPSEYVSEPELWEASKCQRLFGDTCVAFWSREKVKLEVYLT